MGAAFPLHEPRCRSQLPVFFEVINLALTRLSNLDLIDLPNCAGLQENGRCARLDIDQCLGEGCPLMRTPAQEKAALRHTFLRLGSLGEEEQVKIARKYYGGRRVWADATDGEEPDGGGGEAV